MRLGPPSDGSSELENLYLHAEGRELGFGGLFHVTHLGLAHVAGGLDDLVGLLLGLEELGDQLLGLGHLCREVVLF